MAKNKKGNERVEYPKLVKIGNGPKIRFNSKEEEEAYNLKNNIKEEQKSAPKTW